MNADFLRLLPMVKRVAILAVAAALLITGLLVHAAMSEDEPTTVGATQGLDHHRFHPDPHEFLIKDSKGIQSDDD